MKWINVKDDFPDYSKHDWERVPVLAYHTIKGLGIAYFYHLEDEGIIEDITENTAKYICSVDYYSFKLDENMYPHREDLDFYEDGFYFKNLGTITHWKPCPKPPK